MANNPDFKLQIPESVSNTTIGAGSGTDITAVPFREYIDAEIAEAKDWNSPKRMVVFGRIEYTDIFGEEVLHTNAMAYLTSGQDGQSVLSWGASRYHNDAT